MDDWNAQKMLDLYIHDYLVKNNMHTTADILAEEAGIEPRTIVPGFLSEWWSLFWDTYSARHPNNPQAQGARASSSSSQTPMNDGSLPQNDLHGPPVPAVIPAKPNVFNFNEVARMLKMVDESEKPMNEDIAARSSSDEASHSMDITYMQTSSRKQKQ